jgi:hypothetical protein
VLEQYTLCIFVLKHAEATEYISQQAFTLHNVSGATLVPIFLNLLLLQPVVTASNAVYGCVLVTGIVNQDIVQLIVFVLSNQTYQTYVVTVVQLTAPQYIVSVIVILSQVVNAIAPCIIVGFVRVVFFIRVPLIAYVVAFALIVLALTVLFTKLNQSISDMVRVCAQLAAIETLDRTQSVKVQPAKQRLIVNGDTSNAVVGLFHTHTLEKVIAVAISESNIASTKQLFDTFTEYA